MLAAVKAANFFVNEENYDTLNDQSITGIAVLSRMSVISQIQKEVKTLEGISPSALPLDQLKRQEPIVFKGLVNDWELKRKSAVSDDAAIDYIKSLYNGRLTLASIGDASDNGRFFYNDEFSALNYQTKRMRVDEVLDKIAATFGKQNAPHFYIPSNPTPSHFPDFLKQNDLRIPIESEGEHDIAPPLPSLWIGNKTIASCHYDMQKNIACCTTGKRRFILFPPSQIENLYPGPFEPTPGGQVISLVDFDKPDFNKYPKFTDALKHAQIAELLPGDAIFIPSMWWHHVKGLEQLNILVNFWWSETPRFIDPSLNLLQHAILSLRDKSEAEKQAWKHLLDYYVFSPAEHANAHIPKHARGILETLDDTTARQLRAKVIDKLNR